MENRSSDTTMVETSILKLILRGKVFTMTGPWRIDDHVTGAIRDTLGLPITYDYLVNVRGQNHLIYPDDLPAVARIENDLHLLTKEPVEFRLLTSSGDIKQLHLEPQEPPSFTDEEIHARRILDTMRDACFELDNNGNIVFANKRGKEMIRDKVTDIVGKNVWHVFPDLVATRGYEAIQRKGLEKKEYTRDEYLSELFGHWISLRITPTADGCIVLFHEIEDVMEARRKLEDEHRRLKQAQAIGHIGSFEWDAASDRFYWSDEMFRIHQMEPQSHEITWEEVMEFVHPDDRSGVLERIISARETPSNEKIIHRLMLKDGSIRWVKRCIESFSNDQGKITHLTGTIQDITENKASQELVEKHLQILQQTEEVAEMGSWEYDHDEHKFTWSGGMYRIFQIDPGTTVSPEIYCQYAVAEDEPVAKKIVDIILNVPAPFVETLRIRTAGKTKTLKVKGTVLKNEKGKSSKVVGVDVDITTMTESAHALKEQEHFISNIVSTIPDLITVIDLPRSRIEYINRDPSPVITKEQLMDMDPSERAGMIHPDDVPMLKHYFDRFQDLADEVVNTVEFRAKVTGVDWQWFRSHGRVFGRSANGTATHCVNVVQNITHARKTQNEIVRMKDIMARRAESKYEELFRSIDQGFAIVELIYSPDEQPFDYRIDQTNPALERITGFKNIMGRRLREFVPHAPEDWFKRFATIVRAQCPMRFTVKAEELGGAWFEIYAFPTGEPEAHKIGVLFNDITERKVAEKTLQDKQLKLQIAQRAARVGIWEYSLASRKGTATDEWMELTGYPDSREDWSLETFLKLVHPDDASPIERAFNSPQKNRDLEIEFRITHHKRGLQWFLMRGSYISSTDETENALMGSIIDITDRKAFEDQKEQFIGVASHELKTPVTSIKAYAEILRELYGNKGETTQSMMMERMVSQVDRLSRLINDLLDTTRITGGGLMLERTMFDVNEIIYQRVEEMQRTTTHRLIVRPDNLPHVYADKDRISQVLTNLVSNAIKYSPPGSDILISSSKQDNNIFVRVRDYGIGLSEGARERVFERFYRVNDERINTVTGLGLGLFIASEIIRKHHGVMGVISKEDKGSEFYFTIPLMPPPDGDQDNRP